MPINWISGRLASTKLDLTIVRMSATEPFSRGQGLNATVPWARYSTLFFMDADMLFTPKVLQHAVDVTRAGKAYFPVCWTFDMPSHAKGHWRDNGHGIVAVSYNTYIKANRWDEYKQWGSEDLHFFERVSKLVPVVRNRETELRHQWHPQLNSTRSA